MQEVLSQSFLFDGLGKIDRAAVVAAIKEEFQRSYFVTGKILIFMN